MEKPHRITNIGFRCGFLRGKDKTARRNAKKFNGNLIKRLRELCPPPMDVEVTGGVLASGYINREDGTELLFLANTANTKKAVSFGKEGEAYLIYDPLDCTVTEISGRCELSLEGYRAAMVVRPVGSGSVMQK